MLNIDDLEPILDEEDENDEEVDPYKKKLFEIKCLEEELAYHEASHFVFSCIFQRLIDGFTPVEGIEICAENIKDGNSNLVKGFVPNIPHEETYGTNNVEAPKVLEFFKSDTRRLLAKFIVLISGFSSYQVFIEENNYCIGSPESLEFNNDKTKFSMLYFTVRTAIHSQTTDFTIFFKMLRNYCNVEEVNSIELTTDLVNAIQEIMKIQCISDSIRYVKNILIRYKCKRIEGQELVPIMFEIHRLTAQFKFEAIERHCNKILVDLGIIKP